MRHPVPIPALALVTWSLCSATALAQLSYQDRTGAIAATSWDNGRCELELGDLNGDGHPDLVTVGDHGSPFIGTQMHGITAWLGDGAGGWTLVQAGDFGYGGLALGDANGDGLMDVAYGVHHDYGASDLGDQLLEVALGDGSGAAWTPWDDGLATSGETWGMFGTDLGDVDGDGGLDVGSISFGCCAGVHVYHNHGDGTWSESWGFLGGNSDQTFTFGDVDGDGNLDAIAGHQDGAVWRGDGAGGFVAASGNLPATDWQGNSVGDLDGDGADELAFVSGGGLRVWSWGPGDVWVSRSGNLPAGGDFDLTQLVDMDQDGLAELVAFGGGTLAVVDHGAGDVWTPLAMVAVPGTGSQNGEALRAGVDLDHNGLPDLALVQEVGISSPFGGSTHNEARVLVEASAPAALQPHALAPSAGRRWLSGQARFVDWTCAVPSGAATIDLELSTTGPGGPWTTVASGLANSGRHQWVVPAGIASSTCHLRYGAADGATAAHTIGPAFTIEPQPGKAAVVPYGCQVNPAGSLTHVMGLPRPAGVVVLALDNPLGTQGPGTATFLALAGAPDASYPCGSVLPGWGMGGPTFPAELLVDLTALVQPLQSGPTWGGAPVTLALPVPSGAALLGLSVFTQGVLLDPVAAAGVDLALTGALELRIGL